MTQMAWIKAHFNSVKLKLNHAIIQMFLSIHTLKLVRKYFIFIYTTNKQNWYNKTVRCSTCSPSAPVKPGDMADKHVASSYCFFS